MKNTKQKILEVSLELFSRKGFSAVSVRDICGQVPIKESSMYYYFKNKQAILEELLEQFGQLAAKMMGRLEQGLDHLPSPGESSFYQHVCRIFFEDYLMDDFCNKVIRLLSIEQFHSETVQKLYNDWLFDRPLQFQSQVFSVLIQAGLIPAADCRNLAVKYYAPIYLFAQRWLFSGLLSEDRKNAFRTAAYDHVQQFFAELKGKTE